MAEDAARESVRHIDAEDGWEPDDETGGFVRMVRESDGLSKKPA